MTTLELGLQTIGGSSASNSTSTTTDETNEECWDSSSGGDLFADPATYSVSWQPIETESTMAIDGDSFEDDDTEIEPPERQLSTPHPPLTFPYQYAAHQQPEHLYHSQIHQLHPSYPGDETIQGQTGLVSSVAATAPSPALSASPSSSGHSTTPYHSPQVNGNNFTSIRQPQAHHSSQGFHPNDSAFRQDSQSVPLGHMTSSGPRLGQPHFPGHVLYYQGYRGNDMSSVQGQQGMNFVKVDPTSYSDSHGSPHPQSPTHMHHMTTPSSYQSGPHQMSHSAYNHGSNFSNYHASTEHRMTQFHQGHSHSIQSSPIPHQQTYAPYPMPRDHHMASHAMQMTNNPSPYYPFQQSSHAHPAPQSPKKMMLFRRETRQTSAKHPMSSQSSPSSTSTTPTSMMYHRHPMEEGSAGPDFESGLGGAVGGEWFRVLVSSRESDGYGALLLGDSKAALNWSWLCQHRIHVVVNCTTEIENKFTANRVIYKRVPLDNGESADPSSHLLAISDDIHSYLLQGLNVLVHCDSGRNRALCIATAYLIRYQGYQNLQSCVDLFRSQDIQPTLNQRARSALDDWQHSLFHTKPTNFFKPLSRPKLAARARREAKNAGKPRPIPKARKQGDLQLPTSKVEDIRRYLSIPAAWLHRNVTKMLIISEAARQVQMEVSSEWARLPPGCYEDSKSRQMDITPTNTTTTTTEATIAATTENNVIPNSSTPETNGMAWVNQVQIPVAQAL